ncbi:MAG: hypothetical protein E6778_12750 [Niallia nealsonii]|nr:hypothetical protein [Niallia nealsonii]
MEQKRGDLILITKANNVKGTSITNYNCEIKSAKFCLFEIANEQPIFTMDFFHGSVAIPQPYIRLQLLFVHMDKFRKLGIATYYMKKLIKYAEDNKIGLIRVTANPDDRAFFEDKDRSNILKKEQLRAFYKKFETERVKIEVD